MDNHSIHNFLNDLEEESRDDFGFLESTGAKFFTTGELMELRGRSRERIHFYRQWHRANIILGASSPAWIILGFIFGILGLQGAAKLSLLLFPICVLLFVGGALYLKRQFRSIGYQEHIARLIETELMERQNNEMTRKKS